MYVNRTYVDPLMDGLSAQTSSFCRLFQLHYSLTPIYRAINISLLNKYSNTDIILDRNEVPGVRLSKERKGSE